MRLRSKLVVSAIALAILVPAALAADTDRSFGQKVDDALLGTKVKAKLLKDLGADALEIDVAARSGVVTLRGTVDDRASAEQSESIAKSVEGVRRVKHRVKVESKPTETPVADAVSHAEREVADAVLETRVKSALLAKIGKDAFDVEVEATDGTVSLSGRLEDEESENLALRTARETEGVEKVIDLIKS